MTSAVSGCAPDGESSGFDAPVTQGPLKPVVVAPLSANRDKTRRTDEEKLRQVLLRVIAERVVGRRRLISHEGVNGRRAAKWT